MKLEPLEDRVALERVPEQTGAGRLYIPETAREKPQEFIVAEVGPGRFQDGKLVPMTVEPGDRVLLGKYSGVEVTIGKVAFTIVRESEILGVLR